MDTRMFLFLIRRLCGVEYPSFTSLHISNHGISPVSYLRQLLKSGIVYLLGLDFKNSLGLP